MNVYIGKSNTTPPWTVIDSDSTATSTTWNNLKLAKSYTVDYTWDIVVEIVLQWESSNPVQYPTITAKIQKNGVDVESFYNSYIAPLTDWTVVSNTISITAWDTIDIYINGEVYSTNTTTTYYKSSEIRVA